MKYEVIEAGGEWIVHADEVEVARFTGQSAALEHVAVRLRQAQPEKDAAVSLRVRYQSRG